MVPVTEVHSVDIARFLCIFFHAYDSRHSSSHPMDISAYIVPGLFSVTYMEPST